MSEVRIPTVLRNLTNQENPVTIPDDAHTVGQVIDDLEARFPGFKDALVADDELRKSVNVYLDDDDVRFIGGLATTVTAESTIAIIPAVAGGLE